jgi:Ran GTPase-activating protein (RanGAP) involved in mRNA processing and transport
MTVPPPALLRVDSHSQQPQDGVQAVTQAVIDIAAGTPALCLSSYALQDTDAREVLLALSDSHVTRLVELDGNKLGDSSARLLKQALFNPDNFLKILDLNANLIGDRGAFALAEGVGFSRTLEQLDLSFNQLSGVGVSRIAKSLHHNVSLRSFTLNGNRVGDDGAQALADVLPVNSALRILNLRESNIGDVGARSLAQALSLPTVKLTDLALGNNKLGDAGAVAFSEMLKVNSVMKELHIDQNAMTDIGAHALADALTVNANLLMLWFVRNPISQSSVDLFAQALHKNSKLRRLGFTSKDRIRQGTIDILSELRQKRLEQDIDHAVKGHKQAEQFSQPSAYNVPVVPQADELSVRTGRGSVRQQGTRSTEILPAPPPASAYNLQEKENSSGNGNLRSVSPSAKRGRSLSPRNANAASGLAGPSEQENAVSSPSPGSSPRDSGGSRSPTPTGARTERPSDEVLQDIQFFDDQMFMLDMPPMSQVGDTGRAPDLISTF